MKKTKDDNNEDVHVSDVSSCCSESEEQTKNYENLQSPRGDGVLLQPISPGIIDISPVLRVTLSEGGSEEVGEGDVISIDKSLPSIQRGRGRGRGRGRTATNNGRKIGTVPPRDDETPRVGNKSKYVRGRTVADDIEFEALTTPLQYENNENTPISTNNNHTPEMYSQQKRPSSSQSKSSYYDLERDYCNQNNYRRHMTPDLPQDNPQNKSLDSSKLLDRSNYSSSRLNRSTASKWSTNTPSLNYHHQYHGGPIMSPPFVIASPGIHASSRAGMMGRSGNRSNRRGTNMRRNAEMNKNKPTNTTTSARDAYHDMKKEIDDLTAQFEELEKQSSRRKGIDFSTKNDNSLGSSYDSNSLFTAAEEAFEQDLEILSKKSDAMADALQRNLQHSYKIYRDNDRLREEMRNMATSSYGNNESDEYNNDENNGYIHEDMNMNMDALILEDTGITPQKQGGSLLSRGQIISELDPSDDYVRRRYPAVHKTAGTMFVTEAVEVLDLDVGEHSYLSEIMDKQWDTSNDQLPKA